MQADPKSESSTRRKFDVFGTPVVTPPFSIQSSYSHNQPPSAVFGDIGLVFLTLLSWSANEIYRQKGMQREIAFSSSDVLAVTTISMAPRVFFLYFFISFPTHTRTSTNKQGKDHHTTLHRDSVSSKGIVRTLTCDGCWWFWTIKVRQFVLFRSACWRQITTEHYLFFTLSIWVRWY